MKIFITTILALASFLMTAQKTVLFHENFDGILGGDSVTTQNPTRWNETTTVSTTGNSSFHASRVSSSFSLIEFTTTAFSTMGAGRVYLNFDHIAHIIPTGHCYIQVSRNNGSYWHPKIGVPDYFGASTNFFNEFDKDSYPEWADSSSLPSNSWWKGELFDITDYAKNPITSIGSSQVKVKFIVFFPTSSTPAAAGWFIDNIEVYSLPCEQIKPQITFDSSSSTNCQNEVLSGSLGYQPTFSRNQSFIITDNTVIDSVGITEIVNGVTKYDSTMSTISSNLYQYTFNNYQPNDTVQWRIAAYDTCGNVRSFPDTGFQQFYFKELPSKCQSGPCNKAHALINSFPWSENFEGTEWVSGTGNGGNPLVRGTWPTDEFYNIIPTANLNYGWSVRSGATAANNTGPNGGIDSTSGTYLYSEFYGQANSVTAFDLPCIDLTSSSAKILSFDYHMYGSKINSLKIRIDTSSGASPNWMDLYAINGQQHLYKSDPWKKAIVSLEPFAGKIVKIRIVARNTGGNPYTSDVAIDNISLIEAHPVDAIVLKNPGLDFSSCIGLGAIPIKVDIQNGGNDTLHSVPMAYQLDNGPIARDTLTTVNLALTDTSLFTFSQALSFSRAQSHQLKIWSELTGDADQSTDTIVLEIPILNGAAIASFPYHLNFEAFTPKNNQNSGSTNNAAWVLNKDRLGTNEGWLVEEGFQNDYIDGILRGHGKDGKCLVYYGGNQSAGYPSTKFQSNCIDLTGVTNPVLDFMVSTRGTILRVWVRETGQDWAIQTTINVATTVYKDPLMAKQISLAAYAGKQIEIAFVILDAPTSIANWAFIDDVIIREATAKDIALRYVSGGRMDIGTTSLASVQTKYTCWKNGTLNNTYFTLKASFTNTCNPLAPVVLASSDSVLILSNNLHLAGQASFSNFVFSQALPRGIYQAAYWIETMSDELASNDTLYKSFYVTPEVNIPYFNDFEICNSDFLVSGKNRVWEIGPPSYKGTSAYSGNRCAATNLDTTLLNSSQFAENFLTPRFTGLDTVYHAELRIRHQFDFTSSTNINGRVEILNNGVWNVLYDQNIRGKNWVGLMSSSNRGFISQSNGWIESTYPLNGYKASDAKMFRFIANGGSGSWWAIDDFEIYVPKQNSAAPLAIKFTSGPPKVGSNTVAVRIKNSAAAPLQETEVSIYNKGTLLLSETLNFNSIDTGRSRFITLNTPLSLTAATDELTIVTSKPNGWKDQKEKDDTLQVDIYYLSEVNNLPSCLTFENDRAYLDFNPITGFYDSTWNYGTPNKLLLTGAHGGSKAWYIADSTYGPLQNAYLYSSFYPIAPDSCYELSFWQFMDSEAQFDGGLVDYSIDSGATWQLLGKYGDTLWYNTRHVQSLDAVQPGFSGQSNGWKKARTSFKQYTSNSVQFRFRFASNGSINGEGWAIDDVCVEKINGACDNVSINELQATALQARIYPIPASPEIFLQASLNGSHSLRIYDQRGALIKDWQSELTANKALKIDISALAKGMYWLQVQGDTNAPITLKFSKN